ncbi:MAG: hypothetical protein WKF31_12150 [Thermoleophilaceae bacterium]
MSRITAPLARTYRAGDPPTVVAGRANADALGVSRIEVSLAIRRGGSCLYYARGRFSRRGSCSAPRYFAVRGRERWLTRVRLRQPGTYEVRSRATQQGGLVESAQTRENRRTFRISGQRAAPERSAAPGRRGRAAQPLSAPLHGGRAIARRLERPRRLEAVHALRGPPLLDLRRLPRAGHRHRRHPPRAVGGVRGGGLGEGHARARRLRADRGPGGDQRTERGGLGPGQLLAGAGARRTRARRALGAGLAPGDRPRARGRPARQAGPHRRTRPTRSRL